MIFKQKIQNTDATKRDDTGWDRMVIIGQLSSKRTLCDNKILLLQNPRLHSLFREVGPTKAVRIKSKHSTVTSSTGKTAQNTLTSRPQKTFKKFQPLHYAVSSVGNCHQENSNSKSHFFKFICFRQKYLKCIFAFFYIFGCELIAGP